MQNSRGVKTGRKQKNLSALVDSAVTTMCTRTAAYACRYETLNVTKTPVNTANTIFDFVIGFFHQKDFFRPDGPLSLRPAPDAQPRR